MHKTYGISYCLIYHISSEIGHTSKCRLFLRSFKFTLKFSNEQMKNKPTPKINGVIFKLNEALALYSFVFNSILMVSLQFMALMKKLFSSKFELMFCSTSRVKAPQAVVQGIWEAKYLLRSGRLVGNHFEKICTSLFISEL